MSTVLNILLYHTDAFVSNIYLFYYDTLMHLLHKTNLLTFFNNSIFALLILLLVSSICITAYKKDT
jgi:hypothetical protein